MRGFNPPAVGVLLMSVLFLAFVSVSAHNDPGVRHLEGWFTNGMNRRLATVPSFQAQVQNRGPHDDDRNDDRRRSEGQRLFERETFGGNGRTCLTCHSRETGTVSPEDARERFRADRHDALFVHDGSDDEDGDGIGDERHFTRIRRDATILMRISLHPNVTVKHHPHQRIVTVTRGIPTTLNTPALDPVLMLDGRQPTLEDQALGAIRDHAESHQVIKRQDLERIADFQLTDRFFSSPALKLFARGGPAPGLPLGQTESEKRGRTFFEDRPPEPPNFKLGACSACHSGPLLNQTNQFLPVAVPPGTRFQTVLVSELNEGGNPPITFVFHNQPNDFGATNQDGTPDGIIEVTSPDPGRALITGRADDSSPNLPPTFDQLNAFKISPLRGIRRTAPYFHDNSAKTLEDVVEHYRKFFLIVTDVDGPGGADPLIVLSDQDKTDIVAFMKLLD
jgi:cytochrome c peroxidase